MRLDRKVEHIQNYLKTEYQGNTLFSDVFLEHDALTQLSIDQIDTRVNFLGKELGFPLLINSMTGGADISLDINKNLASLAEEFTLAMATGSEKIALENQDTIPTFTITRDEYPDGLIIGNLSSRESLEDAKKAVDILGADALQLHLNPAQELAMEGGDRDFCGVLENIETIVKNLEVPVIVKEVGYGISAKNAKRLYDIGVRYIDLAGSGGTSFLEIEDLRNIASDYSDIYGWGNPTAYLLETCKDLPKDLSLISSGGIKTALDIVKSLVMGADLVGISGEILKYLLHGNYAYAQSYIEETIYKTKMVMALLGARSIGDLKKVDYKITGKLKEMTQ